jgi:isopentenyl-diphosphate delta-isomerase
VGPFLVRFGHDPAQSAADKVKPELARPKNPDPGRACADCPAKGIESRETRKGEPVSNSLIPAWEAGQLRPMYKLAVHRMGLRHMAVSVFVTQGSKLLLQKRAAGKYHSAGLWANTCCTHPHWGEAPADCAPRRLREELGISGLTLRAAGRLEYRADVGNGMIEHEVVDLFLAEAPVDLRLVLNLAEVSATRWADLDTLAADVATRPQDYTAWLRIYLQDHRAAIFGG